MLRDQGTHSDGPRDKGGQQTDQDMRGTPWLPFAKGSQQFFDRRWEESGGGKVLVMFSRGALPRW